jgi:hypothetical protein
MPRSDFLHLVSRHDDPFALVALDRYWDTVARDEPVRNDLINPALAATFHHLHDVDDAPLPDAAFAARLERDLLHTQRRPIDVTPGLDRDAVVKASPLRRDVPLRRRAFSRRVVMQLAAAAALLAMILTSTLIALWAAISQVPERNVARLVLAPGVTDENLLLQARFDDVPDGVLHAAVRRWVLQPGAGVTVGQLEASESGAAYLVESGSVTISPDSAIPLTRAGAVTPTMAPEARSTTLHPGDRMFLLPGVNAQWQNDGEHPVRLLEATFASRDVQAQPAGILLYPVISDGSTSHLKGPIVMTVMEFTLRPEGVLPAASIPGLVMLKVESGRLMAVDVDPAGTPRPAGELGQATQFLGSFPPGRRFRSSNDEPVRLLVVTIGEASPLGMDR